MKLFVMLGALNMFTAVALGAFGAHGLKTRVPVESLATWNTAVLYHLVHGLGLILLGVLYQCHPSYNQLSTAGWLLVSGIVLFCGSLYVLVLSGVKPLGIITPLGGVAFLLGWLLLAASIYRGA